jgi:hypothetical protein
MSAGALPPEFIFGSRRSSLIGCFSALCLHVSPFGALCSGFVLSSLRVLCVNMNIMVLTVVWTVQNSGGEDKGVTSPLGFGSVHAAPGADRGSYREIEPFSMRLRHLHYVCACLFLAGTRGYITTKAEVLEEEVSKRKTVVSSLDAAPVNLLSTS